VLKQIDKGGKNAAILTTDLVDPFARLYSVRIGAASIASRMADLSRYTYGEDGSFSFSNRVTENSIWQRFSILVLTLSIRLLLRTSTSPLTAQAFLWRLKIS